MRARRRRIPHGLLGVAPLASLLVPLLVPLLVLLLLPFPLRAADAGHGADVRAGVGAEVVHLSGAAAGSLKVGPLTALAWHSNAGAGFTADFGPGLGWSGGVGAILLDRTDEVTGTNLNFLFRGSYCGERLCFTLLHISHGALLGIQSDKSNLGLNFMMLEYRH